MDPETAPDDSNPDGPNPDGAVPGGALPEGGTTDELAVEPAAGPLDAVVRPPGSKSLTNRALVCAALAAGPSRVEGILRADDTDAMLGCLRDLGVRIVAEDTPVGPTATVVGTRGRPPAAGAVLDARLSGTTARFIAPVAALVQGTVVLDGGAPLRRRPIGDLADALVALGSTVEPLGEPGHLPLRIATPANAVLGGSVELSGDVSSQFLSGLLLSAPCFDDGLEVRLTTSLVSRPYVEMTVAVMDAFGAAVDVEDDWTTLRVAPTGYRAVDGFAVEPDASAASYLAAAAVVTDGTVRILGLGRSSHQGDVGFIDVLARMGAEVTWGTDEVTVRGTGRLRGLTVDMSDISDTAQTLAAVAPFADSPTTVTGIGFIRGKETDRIAAVVTELHRLGIDAMEEPDGFTVRPGTPRPGLVQTYDDHRMAMSFAVLGLRSAGVRIHDPGCVAKTYPGFWTDLGSLRRGGNAGAVARTP
jgi:3-phosphoshikimate 1-carboxyvinyltransferase